MTVAKKINDKKTLLSGVKPTGRPHIGNYFGAMKQFVDLLNTEKYDCYFMIADYHALNFIQNPREMNDNIIDLAIDYMAIGLDPKKCVLFKQSDVSAHTELAWIFDTLTTMPYLERAHAYKDAQTKNKEISVGTFNYPMLMAADILLYGTDIVPVGQDQKQHVEITRDTAQKFNRTFGEIFKTPEAFILEDVKVVSGIDGRKMSKSYGNDISLFATDEQIDTAVMSIVTDSGSATGIPTNVYAIHELLRDKNYLDKLYTEKRGRYKELKDELAKDLKDFIRPMRQRREKIAKNRRRVIKILESGAKQARKKADATLMEVKETIGVIIK